jgi:hypothetical protein
MHAEKRKYLNIYEGKMPRRVRIVNIAPWLVAADVC